MEPSIEPAKNMTIAIRLSPEAETKLLELAAQRGQDVAGVAADLLEKQLQTPMTPWRRFANKSPRVT